MSDINVQIPIELALEFRVLLSIVRGQIQDRIKEANGKDSEILEQRLARCRESDCVLIDAIVKALSAGE